MKKRSINNLAVIDKNVKSMLLIEFFNVVINPKAKWNTGQVKVGNLIFLNNNLFQQFTVNLCTVRVHFGGRVHLHNVIPYPVNLFTMCR